MFQFMVNADGGLTTAGVCCVHCSGSGAVRSCDLFAGKKSSEKKKMSAKTACILRHGGGACLYYVLPENFSPALGRKCHTVQYALYCAYCQLVRPQNRCNGRSGLRNPAVYPGTYVLSFFQVCCDYVLALLALGVAGFFAKAASFAASAKFPSLTFCKKVERAKPYLPIRIAARVITAICCSLSSNAGFRFSTTSGFQSSATKRNAKGRGPWTHAPATGKRRCRCRDRPVADRRCIRTLRICTFSCGRFG